MHGSGWEWMLACIVHLISIPGCDFHDIRAVTGILAICRWGSRPYLTWTPSMYFNDLRCPSDVPGKISITKSASLAYSCQEWWASEMWHHHKLLCSAFRKDLVMPTVRTFSVSYSRAFSLICDGWTESSGDTLLLSRKKTCIKVQAGHLRWTDHLLLRPRCWPGTSATSVNGSGFRFACFQKCMFSW